MPLTLNQVKANPQEQNCIGGQQDSIQNNGNLPLLLLPTFPLFIAWTLHLTPFSRSQFAVVHTTLL